jgi:hypothetical protein
MFEHKNHILVNTNPIIVVVNTYCTIMMGTNYIMLVLWLGTYPIVVGTRIPMMLHTCTYPINLGTIHIVGENPIMVGTNHILVDINRYCLVKFPKRLEESPCWKAQPPYCSVQIPYVWLQTASWWAQIPVSNVQTTYC